MQNNFYLKTWLIWYLFFIVVTGYAQDTFIKNDDVKVNKQSFDTLPYPKPTNHLKNITAKEGLSNNTVFAIIQDKFDFIWIGTKDGLNRYDGYTVKTYRNRIGDTTSLSHNEIWDLAEDQQGNIWVATYGGGINKYNPETDTFKNYLNTKKDSLRTGKNHVMSVFVDSQNRIWAGDWYSLNLYSPSKDRFETILFNPDQIWEYSTYCIQEDKRNNIWIGTDGSGIIGYDPIQKKISKHYKPNYKDPSNKIFTPITAFIIDKNNDLWIRGNRFGIIHVDSKTAKMNIYDEYFQSSEPLSYNVFLHQDTSGKLLYGRKGLGVQWFNPENIAQHINKSTGLLQTQYLFYDEKYKNVSPTAILEDKAGSLWVGTQTKGVIYIAANSKAFHYTKNITSSSDLLSTQSIKKVIEDDQGFLWFVGDDFGLAKKDPKTDATVGVATLLPQFNNTSTEVNFEDLTKDKDGNIWITTLEHGLICLNPKTLKSSVYYIVNNPGTPSYLTKKYNPKNKLAPLNNIIMTSDGTLCISSIVGSGLILFHPQKNTFSCYVNADGPEGPRYLPGYYINCIYEGVDKQLYVGFSNEGLYRLNERSKKFQKVSYSQSNSLMNSGNVLSIYQYNKDVLWIGTDKGLFKKDLKTNQVTQYTRKEGLNNNYISNIIGDNTNRLWITSNGGVNQFDPQTETFKSYDYNDGLGQTEYNLNATFRSKTGLIFLGGTKGYNSFKPKEISENSVVPNIVITNFSKKDSSGNFVNIPNVNSSKAMLLSYQENDFTVEFAALEYTNPSSNQYRYRLEGYNKDWVQLGNKREITFTNLNEGTYSLRIMGSNNDGVWNEMQKPIDITILPPWWRSWWAYFLYFSCAVFVIYFIHRYRTNKLESIKLKELDTLKSKLFANISHELRTPLTLISGPVYLGLDKYKDAIPNELEKILKTVQKNTKSLHVLIDDILDLSKLDAHKIELKEKTSNICLLLNNITNDFIYLAEQKSIQFIADYGEIKNCMVTIDNKKLQKILNNLLSNAIKYTQANGTVYLKASLVNNKLCITVKDNGIGISERDMPYVFDRYYQSQDTSKPLEGGTGIGLALVKELVNVMQGTINLQSKISKGTEVTLSIPANPVTKTIDTSTEEAIIEEQLSIDNYEVTDIIPTIKIHEHTILVVEDTPDMLYYIKSILTDFKVVTAKNGVEALKLLQSITVDLVISDLMMPMMDGYSLLKTVKEDEKNFDIPFIILTALTATDKKLKALTIGADDYLTKPFEPSELIIRAHNLIQRYTIRREDRKRQLTKSNIGQLTNSTAQEYHQDQLPEENDQMITSADIKLIETIAEEIENNLENPDFKLSDLSEKAHLGERQLRRKIKSITGLTPKQFQQEIILKKALKLLENKTYHSVKAVALSVGINNVTRFNSLFEKRFGRKPVSYLRF
ncbi:hybrid sensor histidine kinase/response regulator transcription factor [Aquimarina brevivitae]|uniref:histidine kinase n=1 Tax=Aquimarina brevivitae TaxID=323412 RepID=A0A4Q7P1A0_9FLAO|nr:two-component regulator propeller domain-containing protein [Aquimarina brevivitae]RZS93337.1 two component regulator with propeller domain [Aquimarina brevivitae]